ncbi:MAG: hypothetical protein ACD_11C00004G0043 [uncultured bacterium]|nr:MAG: hypothetical protein ACD_11C00004G0043 [uncultured bacterium]HBR71941.1 hypothetical protein [Candidatus Moranbacteria bacterium]
MFIKNFYQLSKNVKVPDFVKNEKLHKQFVYPFLPVICSESADYCYVDNPLAEKLGIEKFPKFITIWKDNYEEWNNRDFQKISDGKRIELIIDECREIIRRYNNEVRKMSDIDYGSLENEELAEFLKNIDVMLVEIYHRYIFLIHEYIESDDAKYIKLLPEVRIELSDFVEKIYKYCDYVIDALAKRFHDIPWRTFTYATFDEIIDLLKEKKKAEEFLLINNRPIAFVFDGKKVSLVKGQESVNEIVKVLKEHLSPVDIKAGKLEGKIAFGGKAEGLVIKISEFGYGKVDEILNEKRDYILVIPMTRPECVPYLKNCKAIITDEGGITCHAAIVARELKKPCVTGTRVATEVLMDGDLVEVDADNGVVRILEKR